MTEAVNGLYVTHALKINSAALDTRTEAVDGLFFTTPKKQSQRQLMESFFNIILKNKEGDGFNVSSIACGETVFAITFLAAML